MTQAQRFPTDEFTALLKRLPSYAKLAWSLSGDKRLSRTRRAAVLAAAGYVVSPVDLVPGIIPVIGQLDDLGVALFANRVALNGLPPEARAERLAAAGVSPGALDAALATTRRLAGWIARAGLRVTTRAARA